jgi:hypothetical protein
VQLVESERGFSRMKADPMEIMKVLILIAAAGLVLILLTGFSVFKPSPLTVTSAQVRPSPTPDSTASGAELKELLFADQQLEEVLKPEWEPLLHTPTVEHDG